MRLIRGDDLRTVVRRDGALSPERAAAVAERIGDALDAIHRAGYVHRDVKPPNVLIDDDGHVYLSDFGLAKAALATRGPTTADHWVGTLDYVAPEQIRGGMVDARTDVYALGGVVHFMLTGQPPFVREGDEAKLWAHLHDPAPRPSTTAGVPLAFDTIVARALAKEPADRYASAGELGRDALAASRGDDVTAMTVIARRPLAPKGARRWRGVAALGAAAAVGAVAALLLTGDPAPEGSEPPSAEASPTATSEPPPEPRDEPALTEVEHLRSREQSARGAGRSTDRNAWIVASSRSHPVRFRLPRREPAVARRSSAAARRRSSADRGNGLDRLQAAESRRPPGRRARARFSARSTRPLGPSALAVGTSGLWVATQDRRDESRRAPALHARRRRRGSAACRSTTAWRTWCTAPASMWMAVEDTRTIRRYDRRLVRWRVATDLLALPSDLAWGGGRLWALSGGRTLTRFDPETKDSTHEDLPGLPGRVGIAQRPRRRRAPVAGSPVPGRRAHDRAQARAVRRRARRPVRRRKPWTGRLRHGPERAMRSSNTDADAGVAAVLAVGVGSGREPGGSAPLDTG